MVWLSTINLGCRQLLLICLYITGKQALYNGLAQYHQSSIGCRQLLLICLYITGKQALYNGLAQYHQSRVCNADKAIGEEISRQLQSLYIFCRI